MIGIVLVDLGRVGALISSRPRPIERRVPLRVPLDLDDVGVARHAPDLLNRIPVARRVVAQPTVGLERIHVEQRVEQVDRRRVGDGHDSPKRSRRTHSLGGLRERAGPAAPCAPRRTQPRRGMTTTTTASPSAVNGSSKVWAISSSGREREAPVRYVAWPNPRILPRAPVRPGPTPRCPPDRRAGRSRAGRARLTPVALRHRVTLGQLIPRRGSHRKTAAR